MVTIKDYEKAINAEIKRVRKLTTTSMKSPWNIDTTPADYNVVHEGDDISVLKKVGKRAAEKFYTHSIETVGDLKQCPNEWV